MLLASKSYVEGALALVLYCALLLDDQETLPTHDGRSRARLLLDVLTPVTKSWPSRWCLAANDFAIQICGGYGYSREFPVEQLYRDNRLNMIHEGTNGIQVLDLLGRKVRMNDGAGLNALSDAIHESILSTRDDFPEYSEQLKVAWEKILTVTQRLWADNCPSRALANAATYLECFGHIVIAWMWLEKLRAAINKVGDFYEGKFAAAKHFYVYELPCITTKLEFLDSMDTIFLDVEAKYF
jgi:hypothetical protein